VPGSKVERAFASPAGDPVVYRVKGSQIALRREDADMVEVGTRMDSAKDSNGAGVRHCNAPFACRNCPSSSKGNSSATEGSNLPDAAASLTVALAGNPNTGKSTVFNALTGLRQHVGNWPGKTVTRAEGGWRFQGRRFRVVDLPGTYSLLSASTDEEIARDFVLFGAPDCTVIVADATALERNLNLILQVLEITDRAVVCVNLIDEARRWGLKVDADALREELGVPVVLAAARQGEGMEQLKQSILDVATGRTETVPARIPYDSDLQKAVDDVAASIDQALPDLPNARWIAMRLIDGGDARLREEMAGGVLADLAGRIGAGSLRGGMKPDHTEVRR
jgi:ferrous iron transport protein B